MKYLFIFFYLLQNSFASNESVLAPIVLDELIKFSTNKKLNGSKYLEIFERFHVSQKFIQNLQIDKQAKISFHSTKKEVSGNHLGFHTKKIFLDMYRIDVIENEDDIFNDDIYVYSIVSDGPIPKAKTSRIYKNLDSGDSVLLSTLDRRLYPLTQEYPSPKGALIVDYTLIESDGDDIKELKKLTDALAPLVLAAYQQYTNQSTPLALVDLHGEMKALAKYLLELNDDDIHFTKTLAFSAEELRSTPTSLPEEYVQRAHGHHWGSRWEYRVRFRLTALDL